jgi:hypothetical protein
VRAVRARLARGAGRLFNPAALRRLAGWPAVATVVCVALIVVVAYRSQQHAPADDSVGNVPRVGPVDGQQADAYLNQSRSQLAALPVGRTVWALVGFTGYQRPEGITSLLAGYQVDRVLARVPLPDVQTQLVTLVVNTLSSDVPTDMRRVATAKEKAATDAESQAAAAGTSAELARVDASDAVVERREAAAYRTLCACLYAAVLRADQAQLRVLSGRPGVRVVDPAPEVTRLDRATFVPLLPEQTEIVGPPGDTAVASPTPSSSAG